jgi:hypothetical protein
MRFLLALLLGLALSAPAAAQTAEFLGQKFEKKFEGGNPANASRFVEFGLPPEDIKQWTRMVSYRVFPKMEQNAVKAVNIVARLLMERDKGARYSVIQNEKTREAMIDFLTGAGETMEFNVFKYTPAPGGGMAATQYALRFRLGEMTPEEMKKIRSAAVSEMAKYDQKQVFEYFGLK